MNIYSKLNKRTKFSGQNENGRIRINLPHIFRNKANSIHCILIFFVQNKSTVISSVLWPVSVVMG